MDDKYISYDKLVKDIRNAYNKSHLGSSSYESISSKELLSVISSQPKVSIEEIKKN